MKMFFLVSKFLNKRFGVVPPEKIRSFYDDYHRYLRSQGVDGVKVDAQSVVRLQRRLERRETRENQCIPYAEPSLW